MKKLILLSAILTSINVFGAGKNEELAVLATAAQSSQLGAKLEELREKGFYLKGLDLAGRARCAGVLVFVDVQVGRYNEKTQSADQCFLKMQVGDCESNVDNLKVGGVLPVKCRGADGHLYGITD